MKLERIAACGAEVSEITISPDLSDVDILAIGSALSEHGVLFFRDQDLSGDELVAFSQRFGESFIQPAVAHLYKELLFLENDADRPPYLNTFHQDMTGLVTPPRLHMLHALEVPDGGGDTIWSCSYSAFEALSETLQEFLCTLTATHDLMKHYAPVFARWENGAEKVAEFNEHFPPTQHPVVRTDPETGRKGLFVNPFFTVRIDNVTDKEGQNLLNFLYDHIALPEFCGRLRWQVGTLAIWDNHITSHYAVADYFPQRRKMQRASVCGGPIS